MFFVTGVGGVVKIIRIGQQTIDESVFPGGKRKKPVISVEGDESRFDLPMIGFYDFKEKCGHIVGS